MDTNEPAFALALDPMRPQDLSPPPGMAQRPPYCPTCPVDVFLYPVQENGVGDMLFECLNDGYEAIWRKATDTWEPRPGREEPKWLPPYLVAPSTRPKRTAVVLPTPPPSTPSTSTPSTSTKRPRRAAKGRR